MPSPAIITSVDSSASNQTLLTEAANRTGKFTIHNTDANTLYVKYGATATTSSFSYELAQGDTLIEESYFGQVDGIWNADGSGAAKITVY